MTTQGAHEVVVWLELGPAAGRIRVDRASLDALEARFEQMALAARRSAWSREFHMDSFLAAGLLILREFMHHAGFDRIELRGGDERVDGEERK